MTDPAAPAPRAVLFVCNLNRVRSPMAAALLHRRAGAGLIVDSGGVEPGDAVDPFAVAVMSELGVDLADHEPKGVAPLDDGGFDLVIALTPEARDRTASLAGRGIATEYWPIEDPTVETGSRLLRLEAYRRVRDAIARRVTERFSTLAQRRG